MKKTNYLDLQWKLFCSTNVNWFFWHQSRKFNRFWGEGQNDQSRHPHQSAASNTFSSTLPRTLPVLAATLSNVPSWHLKGEIKSVLRKQPWLRCVPLQSCWQQLRLLLWTMRAEVTLKGALWTPRYRTSIFKQVCRLCFLPLTSYNNGNVLSCILPANENNLFCKLSVFCRN